MYKTIISAWALVLLVLGFGYSMPTQAATKSTMLQQTSTRPALPDPDELVAMLERDEIAALDKQLSALQRRYEADTYQEKAVSIAVGAFARAVPELEAPLSRWVSEHPQSYVARVARGEYFIAMAWAFRGNAYASKTHQSRFEAMRSHLQKAGMDLNVALTLSSRPTGALANLIEIARVTGGREEMLTELNQAVAVDPDCITPRRAYFSALTPSWGGSYKEMRRFIDETAASNKHPKIKEHLGILEGDILVYQGDELFRKQDYAGALQLYRKAREFGENTKAERRSAAVYEKVNQLNLAVRSIDWVLERSPNDDEALNIRSQVYLSLRDSEKGLSDLRKSAERGNMEAMQQLADYLYNGSHGVPRDMKESFAWFERAAFFLDPWAQFSVGKSYELGQGVKANHAEAAKWYRLAAAQGSGPAENDLGMLLWYGRGVTPDKKEAAKLWRRAADRGIWQGQHNLKFFLGEVYPLGKPDQSSDKFASNVFLGVLETSVPYGHEIGSLLRAGSQSLSGPQLLNIGPTLFALLGLFGLGSVILGRRLALVPGHFIGEGDTVPEPLNRELSQDERPIWWGRPKTGLSTNRADYLVSALGLVLIVMAMLWLIAALQRGEQVWALVAGGIVLLLGMRMAAVRVILDAMRRARTLYAITGRRIIIVGWSMGRQVRSIPLRSLREVSLDEGKDGYGDVAFAAGKHEAAQRRAPSLLMGRSPYNNYFEGIGQARAVHDLLLRAQDALHQQINAGQQSQSVRPQA